MVVSSRGREVVPGDLVFLAENHDQLVLFCYVLGGERRYTVVIALIRGHGESLARLFARSRGGDRNSLQPTLRFRGPYRRVEFSLQGAPQPPSPYAGYDNARKKAERLLVALIQALFDCL